MELGKLELRNESSECEVTKCGVKRDNKRDSYKFVCDLHKTDFIGYQQVKFYLLTTMGFIWRYEQNESAYHGIVMDI